MKYTSQFTINERNLKITKAEAYWISPKGRILPVTDRHIAEIIKNPIAFGFDSDYIEALYAEHDEKIGTEGKAREKLIVDLVNQGWIRVRNYIRQNKWSINMNKLSDKNKDFIKYFADAMLKVGYSPYEELIIDTPVFRKKFTMGELSQDILYMQENKKCNSRRYGIREVKEYNKNEIVKPFIYIN